MMDAIQAEVRAEGDNEDGKLISSVPWDQHSDIYSSKHEINE